MSAAFALHSDQLPGVAVRAAGALVARRGDDDTVRVILVHRLRERDWCFPTGTRRRGEALVATARRAVREQAGLLCAFEAPVGVGEDVDSRGHPRLVRYWAMRGVGGVFTPTHEVDAVAWVRPTEAVLRLTRDSDRRLLSSAIAQLAALVERVDAAH
jgi:8-oxo-dGTP pyrophosphatase MutT (NUDIX family)